MTDDPEDYVAGDVVAYNLEGDAGWLPHIAVVVDEVGVCGARKIVHNIGRGPRLEDALFEFKIIGHYRWFGPDE